MTDCTHDAITFRYDDATRTLPWECLDCGANVGQRVRHERDEAPHVVAVDINVSPGSYRQEAGAGIWRRLKSG